MDYIYVAGSKEAQLAHTGKKGMKWYQHIFGMLDPRAKYNRENIAEATDQELRDFNNRKQLEQQYLNNAATKGVVDRLLESVENKLIERASNELANLISGRAVSVIDGLRAKPAPQAAGQSQPKKNDPPKQQPKQPTQQNQPQKKKK